MRRIDQLLAGYADGDAISREARVFRSLFREMGYESDIFAPPDHIGDGVEGDALPMESLPDGDDAILLYHFSIASAATKVFMRSTARRLVRYHNITPPHFFEGFDDDMVTRLADGRQELVTVVGATDLVLADSEFNAEDARAAGCKHAHVMELVPDLDEVEPDERKIDRYDDAMGNILFVGRIVPNKCIEELILAFSWINRSIDRKSRLIIVGSERSCPSYFSMLKMLATELGLNNVCFEGFLNEAELSACYCCADVYACASLHEGYCLPLVEAMKYGVPVLAREKGGMVQAMSGAGVMYQDLGPRLLGELLAKVMWDESLRKEILASQESRLASISDRDLKAEWSRLL